MTAAVEHVPGAERQPPSGHDLLFPRLPYTVKDRADYATQDLKLQQFVNHATLSKDDARKRVLAESFGERTDAVRELAGNIKQHTLDHLDGYIEQWTQRSRAAGVTVHFAEDAERANGICVDIARKNSCKLCVKSKSMVTEETHLLPALEAIGCETVETDLGEFILQIDDDAPSHIVTPMIHKDKTAVGRAFTRVLGAEYTEDEATLAMIAREHLREKFRRADLGISGGNFLVADTGSLVLCTNEGNGRLCTSAPRVHVAFVGIEKLVPDMDSLAVLLKLLARSSTGQPLTVYTHIITGPRRADEIDGPEEVHVILIDNGRTEVLQAETREMLRCIRCGACLNACPVYRKIGGHAYGSVYSGPIGAILTPALKGIDQYPDLPFASSLCGACYEACPVKINIPDHLIKLRERVVQRNITGWRDRAFMRMWSWSLRRPWAYRLGSRVQGKMFRLRGRRDADAAKGDPYTDRGWVTKLPGGVGGWTAVRDMPTPPAKSFRDWWRHRDV